MEIPRRDCTRRQEVAVIQKGGRWIYTVVGQVEGGEASVGVGEHGVDGPGAVYAAPPAASLPHAFEHPAYRQ